MEGIPWPYFDPDYENLSHKINPPRVVIDNEAITNSTLIKVDSANKHGILLEVVQLLTDLDLVISKAYISSDGAWFMDVFHVTDQLGNKVTDQKLIEFIQQSLGARRKPSTIEVRTCLGRTVRFQSVEEHTVVELMGTDRPGLLSEISAVLTNLKCNVVAAEVWTHKERLACVIYVSDESTGRPIEDPQWLLLIKEQLCNVLKANDDTRSGVKTHIAIGLTHTQRRLHQMMFADRDYEQSDRSLGGYSDENNGPTITIDNCLEKGYSVVSIRCKDRPKLLFDTVCTVTDMQYVVFHATIDSQGVTAIQEYYIRNMNGCTLDTEGERKRVIKCLEAAIQRRGSEGTRLELCTRDRVGLLSDVTRVFRENGLSVRKADVSTRGDTAVNVFYVADAVGGPADLETIEAVRKEMGLTMLQVKEQKPMSEESHSWSAKIKFSNIFSLGSLIKSAFHQIWA